MFHGSYYIFSQNFCKIRSHVRSRQVLFYVRYATHHWIWMIDGKSYVSKHPFPFYASFILFMLNMNSHHKNAFFVHESFFILDVSFLSFIISTDIVCAWMKVRKLEVPTVKKHINSLKCPRMHKVFLDAFFHLITINYIHVKTIRKIPLRTWWPYPLSTPISYE